MPSALPPHPEERKQRFMGWLGQRYGALLDAVYLFNKYANPISAELWKHLRRLVDWICSHWRSVDNGIWEARRPKRHFVYSKLMCWVAVDRALRLAHRRSVPADRNRWLQCRDEIYQAILDEGWNPERRSFVQSHGSSAWTLPVS